MGARHVNYSTTVATVESFERENTRWLPLSFGLALALQLATMLVLTYRRAPEAAVASIGAPPIEAQIFEKPPEQTHLVEHKLPSAAKAAVPEKVLSKAVGVGKVEPHAAAATPTEPEKNQTETARPEIVTHGPFVVSSPAPQLPEHLKNQDLKTSVLIEFVIGPDGRTSPQLIGSSGNEEVDALALKAAQSWTFSPAVQANQPVASKVRLRINFQVD